jgi:hypothetical protein
MFLLLKNRCNFANVLLKKTLSMLFLSLTGVVINLNRKASDSEGLARFLQRERERERERDAGVYLLHIL